MGRLPAQWREQLLQPRGEHNYEAGEVLLRQGDLTTHVAVILSGLVKVTATFSAGREVLLSIRGRGDVVGELAALDGIGRSASVIAWGPVTTTELVQARFLAFMSSHTDAAHAVAAMLGQRLRNATMRRAEMGGRTGSIRVIQVLLQLDQEYGRDLPGGGRAIALPLTYEDLAAAAGVSLRTAQRVLRSLRQASVARKDYCGITIMDAAKLAKFPPVAGERS